MEEEEFDIAIEGTTLKSLFVSDENKRTVVIDPAGNYGTTYSSISALKESPYVNNFKMNVNGCFKETEGKLSIESIPFLLFFSDERIEEFSDTVEFIKIDEIYVFTCKSHGKIPISKNEILDLKLNHKDIFCLYKSIKNQSIDLIKNNFIDKTHFIYKALVEMKIFDDNDFKKYCEGFGNSIFLYPKYGMSELSETLAMYNAFRGTTYIVNKTLNTDFDENSEYKFIFTCNLGKAKSKKFVRNTLIKKRWFVRIVVIEGEKFNGNFVGYIDNNNKITRVIGLNSITGMCSDNIQIVYFISKDSEISDQEIERLGIFPENKLIDMSFETVYDIDQFIHEIN